MKNKNFITLIAVCTMLFAFGIINASAATYGDITYSTSNGEVTITDCDASATDIIIPEKIAGYPVTAIKAYAFRDCKELESITIPSSIKSVGDDAFFNCSGLDRVNISDLTAWCEIDFVRPYANPLYYADNLYLEGNLVTNLEIPSDVIAIKDHAFTNYTKLKSIIFTDNVTTIGYGAFSKCSGLTNITIGNGVNSIGKWAFRECTNLSHLTISNNVSIIGDNAFYGCSTLSNVLFAGDNVKTIGNGAFSSCGNLESIVIPNGVVSIEGSAFQSCSNLVSVTLPNSVTTIGEQAFYFCNNLKDVYYNGTEEDWDLIEIGFNNAPLTDATIHYKELYRINEITIKDMSGNSLEAIPTGTFLATVSFTNVSSSADTVIILAQYTDAGAFKGLMYIQTEDVPTGSTIKLSIPVDNSNGDVAKLKAFCWESFGSLIPMGNSASFPAE